MPDLPRANFYIKFLRYANVIVLISHSIYVMQRMLKFNVLF